MKKSFSFRRLLLILVDVFIFLSSTAGIFCYLYYTRISLLKGGYKEFLLTSAVLMACVFLFRFLFGVYRCIWRYVVIDDYIRVFSADMIGGVVFGLIKFFVLPILTFKGKKFSTLSLIYFAGILALSLILVWLSRLVYQYIMAARESKKIRRTTKGRIPVGIVGAGQTGAMLAEYMLTNVKSKYYPYAFFDVDLDKVGKTVKGIKVYPADSKILETIKGLPIEEIVITVSKASAEDKKRLYTTYEKTGLPIKIYDRPLDEDNNSGQQSHTIRDFKIEDLLFRDAINIQNDTISHFFKDKVVMVTGGGGSIGSELCRQIAKLEPKKLVIFDIYENNAYDIEQELRRLYKERGSEWLSVEIASVRDADKVNCVMQKYRPNMVFHAAAHKHVPLMEHCCDEAIKNNVFGTFNVAEAANAAGVDRFVMISTDKAVNPTNVMGASKRVCEMIVQSRRSAHTQFTAVRFGNVLGSNGSVIPLFRRQIENGGPVTITDKRIIRYFMTIPEAAQLVMQAGVIASQNEIFVLDMGDPVKILELAENMIKLSGLRPYEDIDIVEIGLRPGEKLYEELLIKTETLRKTANNKIFVEKDSQMDEDEVNGKLERLKEALETKDNEVIKKTLKEIVPTYHDPEEVNADAEKSEEMKTVHGK